MTKKMHCKKAKMNCVWIPILTTLVFSWLFHLCHGFKASFVFEKEPENVIAVTGKKVSFSCRASATGKEITYFWKFNGTFLNKDNTYGFKISKGLLQINNVTGSEHRGAYECIAFTKDLGSIKSRKANLKIAYFSGKPPLKPKFERLDFPLPYLLQAPEYKAFPTPTFRWLHSTYSVTWLVIQNIPDMKRYLYVTSKGNLVMPSFRYPYTPHMKLEIYHPAVNDGLSPALTKRFWIGVGRGMVRCPDSSMTSFPTVTNKTAPEGSSVLFECLAVPKSCNYNVSISWTKAGRKLNEKSRRLVLKDVTKMGHEGTYQCHAKLSRYATSITITFNLTVLEKPKLVKDVKPIVSLPAIGILHPAVFDKTASLKWYKDGSIIDKSSLLYDVLPNGNLKIKHPSSAFNGIYQMVYENQAGTKTVSQSVTVNSKVGCGQRIFKLSGSVTYNQETKTWKDVTCIWIFQLPSAKKMQFKIKKFEFRKEAMLSIFAGSTASQSLSVKYSLNVAYVNGPFISMVFNTKASNVGSFTIDYWPISEGPATTVSIKTSKMKPTTGKPINSKPTNSKPKINKPTTNKPTVMKSTMKSTKPDPVKAKQTGCKVCPNTGAIVGGIFGALILIALIVLIIYREKVLQKCGYSRSANVKAAETTSTPMFEVDTSEKTC